MSDKIKPQLKSLLLSKSRQSTNNLLNLSNSNNECINCSKQILANEQKITELLIPKFGNSNELILCKIINIIEVIFKLPAAVVENSKWQDLVICNNCSELLARLYTVNLELNEFSHVNSILNSIINGSRRDDPLTQGNIKSSDFPTGTGEAGANILTNNLIMTNTNVTIQPESNVNVSIPLDSNKIVNLIPLDVVEQNSKQLRVKPVVHKRVKQVLWSADSNNETIIIFETNDMVDNTKNNRKLLIPTTEFIDITSRSNICTECGVGFMKSSSLDFHLHWIHGKSSEVKYVCQICLQPMCTEVELLDHMDKLHEGCLNSRDFSTINNDKKCGKKNNKKSSLKKSISISIEPSTVFPQLALDLRSILEASSGTFKSTFENNIFQIKQPAKSLPEQQQQQRRKTTDPSSDPISTVQTNQEYICSRCTRIFSKVTDRDEHFQNCMKKVPFFDPLAVIRRRSSSAVSTVSNLTSSSPVNSACNLTNSPLNLKPSTSKGSLKNVEDSDDDGFVIAEPLNKKRKSTSQKRRQQAPVDGQHDSSTTPINLTGFICSGCGRLFPSNNGRNEHMLKCSELNSSDCDTTDNQGSVIHATKSDKSIPSNTATTNPVPTFTGTCYCGERYYKITRSDIKNHMEMDHNIKPIFLCSFCERNYEPTNTNAFMKHLQSHDGILEEKFIRTECGLKLVRDGHVLS